MESSASLQDNSSSPFAPSSLLLYLSLVWAAILCFAGRHQMLDDALIHLRYAANLHDHHMISYDGTTPNYGASSLLYVAVLAVLRSLTLSPLLPKLVSLVAYAGLLGFSAWLHRINQFAIALSLVLVSPFAVRWLSDGMETSLVCLLAVTFSLLVYRNVPPFYLGLAALTLSILRVDLTFLVAFGVLLFVIRKQWISAVSLCIGSAISLVLIQGSMGHLLPDTAVAKQGLPFFRVLNDAAHEFIATASFGLGILLLWLVSAAIALRVDRLSGTTLIANLTFPVLLLVAAMRGQQMHGIRYVVWALLFSITWNLLVSANIVRIRSAFLLVLMGMFALAWIIEVPIVMRVNWGRSTTLNAMESARLDQLRGPGVAADVGFIGYFSRAYICDLDGLVNGRAAAKLGVSERVRSCMNLQPTFLFVTSNQIDYLETNHYLNVNADWVTCGFVDFTNATNTDRHWLLVRRILYPHGCPTHL